MSEAMNRNEARTRLPILDLGRVLWIDLFLFNFWKDTNKNLLLNLSCSFVCLSWSIASILWTISKSIFVPVVTIFVPDQLHIFSKFGLVAYITLLLKFSVYSFIILPYNITLNNTQYKISQQGNGIIIIFIYD